MDINRKETLGSLMQLRDLELEYKALYRETGFATHEEAIDIDVLERFLSASPRLTLIYKCL